MLDDFMSMIGVPVAVWVTSVGSGLLVERLVRRRLENALLLPLGLCASLVLTFPGYVLGAGDRLAIALVAAASLLGFLLARNGLRSRLNPGWPGLAGLATYVLFMAPVLLTGHWTWSGYNFDNDTSFEFLLANHLKSSGTHLGVVASSTGGEFVRSYLASGYPQGAQAQLATLSGLLGSPVAVLYQGYISALAATGAVALAVLPGRLVRRPLAALLAFSAVSANLTYQYALQGNIKEVAVLVALCATFALGRAALEGPPLAAAVLVALPLGAVLDCYNAAGTPYVAAFAFSLAVTIVVRQRRLAWRTWWRPVAVGASLMLLFAAPALSTIGTFFRVASAVQARASAGPATELGQLLRPLPLSQITGVWLDGNYRVPVQGHLAGLLTAWASGLMLVLLVPGIVQALRRREFSIVGALVTMGLVLLVVYPRVSGYADGKLLAIASPVVVLVAGASACSLRGRWAPLALLAAGALALGVGVSDVLAYRWERVAPTARLESFRQASARLAGRGLVLVNEQEEYAKYFAGEVPINQPYEPFTPAQVQLRYPAPFGGTFYDLDAQQLSFIERFGSLIIRRSPAASRPPANYRLAYENAYYQGWVRTSRPVVLRHLPEQRAQNAVNSVDCVDLRELVTGAPTTSELVVGEVPPSTPFSVLRGLDRSGGWGLDPTLADSTLTPTPGHSSGVVTVSGGPYAVWVQGDFPAPITIEIDGRAVGSVHGAQGPGQWLMAGSVRLGGGAHTIRVSRAPGRRHLHPGDGGEGKIGEVVLRAPGGEQLRSVPLARWRTLCGRQVDWVEVVQR